MDYEIKIRDIEPIKVATMRFKGPLSEATKQFPNVFKAIKGKANGAPFYCYNKVDRDAGIVELDLCVPTAETPHGNGVTVKELPRGKFICITHVGSYDNLPMAYKVMHEYIEKKGLTVEFPWREIFIKGPGLIIKGNPDKYVTEIMFPMKVGE